MMHRESDDIRMLKVWAENAHGEISRLTSLDALTDWIVANNQRLGRLELDATSTWNQLRAMMHAKDGQLREQLRQGVG